MPQRPTKSRQFCLDQAIVAGQVRPQQPYWCSLAALNTAFNRIHGTTVDEEMVFRLHPEDTLNKRNRGPGNQQVLAVHQSLCRALAVPGDALVVPGRRGEPVRSSEPEGRALWASVCAFVEDPEAAVIVHVTGHYACVAGYYQNPVRSRMERDLLISDSSTVGRHKRTGRREQIYKGMPLWCLSWSDLLENMADGGVRHGLIFLRRTPGRLGQVRSFLRQNSRGARLGLSAAFVQDLGMDPQAKYRTVNGQEIEVVVQDDAYSEERRSATAAAKRWVQMTPAARRMLGTERFGLVEIQVGVFDSLQVRCWGGVT